MSRILADLLHRLLQINDYEQLLGTPMHGNSWETYVINQIKANQNLQYDLFFYRTHAGAELDLLLVKGLIPEIAVEIKFSSTPKVSKGFIESIQTLKTKQNYIIIPANKDYPVKESIRVCGLNNCLNENIFFVKKLLFITSTNLSTNPRLLKEIKLAWENGFEVSFIAFQLRNWSDKTEQEHLNSLDLKNTHYISATKKPFIAWFFSTMIWKLSNLINNYVDKSLKISAFAHNKRSWQLYQKLNKYSGDYDLVIAHNLGPLYPAYKFSEKHQILFAFDIEDYHPGEKCSHTEKQRREFLMQKLLPKAAYISYASPLIGKYSFDLFNNLRNGRFDKFNDFEPIKNESILINNSFSKTEFLLKESQDEKVQLVWFSQNITWGRGLEYIVPVLSRFKEKVHLNLIGNKRAGFYNEFLKEFDDFINYINPMMQNELHLSLSDYDVGLAIEISNIDLNKDVALSNKIFAYAQSGLYILATNTSAQQQFIEEHTLLGLLTSQSTLAMEQTISKVLENIDVIRSNRKSRFEYAKKLAWEVESKKLLNIWNKLFNA